MLSSPVWVFAWSLIALGQNYEMMLSARMLTGFCVGLIQPSAAVYVSCNFVIVHLIYVSLHICSVCSIIIRVISFRVV